MRILRILLAGLCVVAIRASGQTSDSIAKSLTLDECVRLALQHNLDVRIERFNPEIARYNVSLAYAGYDPTLDFRASHSDNTSLGSLINGTLNIPASTTKSDSFNVELAGTAPTDSGLSYSLNGSVSQTTSDRQNANGNVSLSLRQPLLKNLWIDSVRYNVLVSKNQLQGTEQAFQFKLMDIITQVETAYYDLIAARENVKVQEKAMQLAEQLLAENKKKVEVGALAPLDEKQAASQVAASRANLLTAQHTVDVQENLLKGLLSDEFTGWQKTVVEPAEALSAVPQTLSLQASWQNGMTLRPDLEQARLNVDQLGITLKFQRNQIFPQLDLTGTFGRNANFENGVYSDVFGQIRTAQGPYYTVGAEFRIPLGNRAARNNLKITRSQKEQAVLRYKQLEQTVMLQIDNDVKQVQTSLQRVDATKEATLYAQAALEAEQKKLENGKSTSFEVLQLQNNLTAARSAEIQALTDYNKALALLAFNEGTTLQRRGLNLEVK